MDQSESTNDEKSNKRIKNANKRRPLNILKTKKKSTMPANKKILEGGRENFPGGEGYTPQQPTYPRGNS